MASLINISRNPSMMDEDDIGISITNLKPSQQVTLQALIKPRKSLFCSHAHFVADLSGTVNISTANSFGGSYTGISPMGIFWSMQPVDKKGVFKPTRFLPTSDRQPFTLKVYSGHLEASKLLELHQQEDKRGLLLGETIAYRDFMSEGVTKHEVNHGRLRGIIFKPKGKGPFKGVIDIYGGNGGIVESRAALLASHGFVAYTLPFFNYKDLPTSMFGVEIEYFIEAIHYLNSLDYVRPGVAAIGLSFGGGICLYLSSIADQIGGLSSIVVIGAPHYFTFPLMHYGKPYPDESSFQIREEEHVVDVDEYGAMDGCSLIFDERCKDITFKVENCPSSFKFLFVVGREDGNLRAEKCLHILKDRLVEHGKGHQMQALVYPKAGHFIDPPHMPQTIFGLFFPSMGVTLKGGGTIQENNGACRHSWKNMLQFLERNTGVLSKI